MQIKFWPQDLKLAHTWTIASSVTSGSDVTSVGIVQLTDRDGTVGLGEAAPARRYNESTPGSLDFIAKVDATKLSFDNIEASMKYVESLASGQFAAKSAINVALLDGAARKAGKPIYDLLGLGFRNNHHVTSFSIGIDKADVIRKKVLAAEQYPVLKLKVGAADDKANLAALREAAPQKWVRVDANEGWKTKEHALEMIEWLAQDKFIQYIEQPMPADSNPKDIAWLKARSPLPLFGDESYHTAKDVDHCAECYHGVNVKLCKTGGISNAYEALQVARKAGLKTMIGCMIETSILISAAAHLAELCDYLDIDGNLLTTNDPYLGVTAEKGLLSFASAPEKLGLRVRAK
ncbi:dipeptide epimerase [Pedosphaera parvula]|uniref:L-Ala-D/L-amino acid epimerase n=1 Tax=Pedosphaera parvula (strain Ellin514) TaxID=320771 RepID=AXEP_PEDPL|nr:dipeptide epimerase [Pedosphaera parvula]B9XEK4.1 RecName: Full=L-Ala-D/L-amino acid epimerase [Pedosphaera parvula Ellin514]EEF61718.1 Mandelate racemase/muconate lactonizing protein [Pedosphaera parvula Ellin514]